MTIKQISFLSLIIVINVANLSAKKQKYTNAIPGYPKNINVSETICREKFMLAALNNQAPKLKITIGDLMIIGEGFLWELVERNKEQDQDICEFKNLSKKFNSRTNKKVTTVEELIAYQNNKKEKYFSNGYVYDQAACDGCIKEYQKELQENLNRLDPENREIFEKCSQLLDKICEKYPSKIDSFKKIYEENRQTLLNELQLKK